MRPRRVAIQPDKLWREDNPRHQSYSARWTELLTRDGHEVVPVDVFAPEAFERIRACEGFLWWFPPLPFPRDAAKRIILALAHATDVVLFPDWKEAWHYDDKIAQTYLLHAARIPMPETHVFWRYGDAVAFLRDARYPLVMKLAAGFFAQRVTLIRNRAEGEKWARWLFSSGLSNLHRPFRRLVLKEFVSLWRRHARTLDVSHGGEEQGYMLLQEFVPGNDFDTRVTVIGDRVFATRRYNRPNDFRASGSGLLDMDPAKIDRDALALGLHTARTLGAHSLSLDILRHHGQPVITEVSFGYEAAQVAIRPGHWRGDALTWSEGSVRAEDALLEDFLSRLPA
ncbi:MAG: hypothetical protein JO197_08735 [Acidobacteria bacterium]|nr:hypothetical protein [Acidobacteriota bacterium]MBV9478071.1 hypothetical protein [Acidobacteriota bacterium]